MWFFAEDLVYGVRHDQHLKHLIRAGKTVAAIETFPGLSEALDDVKGLLAAEEHENSKAEVTTAKDEWRRAQNSFGRERRQDTEPGPGDQLFQTLPRPNKPSGCASASA